MKITKNLKMEISNWSKLELVGLVSILSFIFINAYIVKDSPIAVISAVCGILYTIIAGKGKISCYLFGLMGSGFYCYLALKNSLYGNLLLYLAYYIPMQILGIFKWKNNLKKSNNEIYKTRLSNIERIRLIGLSMFVSICFVFGLCFLRDSHPVLDGLATALSIVGMYLTVRRCIEQWVVWTVVNAISVFMWVRVLLGGERVCSTVIMWVVYLCVGVYFYIQWRKELLEGYHSDK